MSEAAWAILRRGVAVGIVIVALLFAALAALDAAAVAEYRRAGFHQVNGRWVP